LLKEFLISMSESRPILEIPAEELSANMSNLFMPLGK
jgi:hypothetical protein